MDKEHSRSLVRNKTEPNFLTRKRIETAIDIRDSCRRNQKQNKVARGNLTLPPRINEKLLTTPPRIKEKLLTPPKKCY